MSSADREKEKVEGEGREREREGKGKERNPSLCLCCVLTCNDVLQFVTVLYFVGLSSSFRPDLKTRPPHRGLKWSYIIASWIMEVTNRKHVFVNHLELLKQNLSSTSFNFMRHWIDPKSHP